VMYASGNGVRQDFAMARSMYEQAVAAGDTHALHNLAVMHALGQGTPPDPVQAQVYYLQHRHAGNPANPQVEQLIDAVLDAAGRSEADQRFQDWLALQDILSAQ
jgi:TPR repeat protein